MPSLPGSSPGAQWGTSGCSGVWGLQGDPQPYFSSRNNGQKHGAPTRPGCGCGQKPTCARLQRGAMHQETPSFACAPQDLGTHHGPAHTQAGVGRLLCASVTALLRGLLSTAPECKHSFNKGGERPEEELSFFPSPCRSPTAMLPARSLKPELPGPLCPARLRHANR